MKKTTVITFRYIWFSAVMAILCVVTGCKDGPTATAGVSKGGGDHYIIDSFLDKNLFIETRAIVAMETYRDGVRSEDEVVANLRKAQA